MKKTKEIWVPVVRINYHNGFYKKMNLMFSYIE